MVTSCPAVARYRFACATCAVAFLLLIAGGLVTSTGSALAVPDWPLSYGKFFPPMVGGVLFEHGHRMIAGFVAFMTWILAGWTWRSDHRRWVRGTALVAALGIVLQAVLGGLTVLFRLPPAISVAHACLAQTVFCLLLVLAQANSPWYLSNGESGEGAEPPSRAEQLQSIWKIGLAAVAVVYLQLILGAVIRHTTQSIGFHAAGAAVATIAVLVVGYKGIFAGPDRLWRPAVLASGLIFVQIALGLSAWIVRSRPPVPADFWRTVVPTAHVVCGAAILGTMVIWSLRAYRLRERHVS